MNLRPKQTLAGLSLALAFAPVVSSAADVTLTADDTFGNSSLNSAGNWNNAAAPSAGNNYFTGGRLLRTPPGTSNHAFAGDSLTVNGNPGAFDTTFLNNAFMFKGGGYTATVANMILDAGYIRHAESETVAFALEGNLLISSRGGGFAVQGPLNIASAVSGSGQIYIAASGNNDTRRQLTFSSSLNTFDGNIVLANATQSHFRLADTGVLNFRIGADGVNNRISGNGTLNLDGTFRLNLDDASTTFGDSWSLVTLSGGAATYGEAFNIEGFTLDDGTGTWRGVNDGISYEFTPTSGILAVVPEPSVFALVGTGLVGLFLRRRKS